MMGAEITAPKPNLSPDKIGKFSAILAMEEAVLPQGVFPKYLDGSNNWSPAPTDEGQDQWEKVKGVWTNPAQGPAKRDETVDLLKTVMGWKRSLSAKVPTRLVENLGNLYLTAPMISVG